MSFKVSIITVCFNSAKTINDTIDSVINQSYSEIEHIVIDGGSTDGTQQIVNSYNNKISQFISERDNGIYDAMNKGIKLATGDIVGILNSDDVYFDTTIIEKVVQQFDSSNCDSVYGDLFYVKSDDLNKIVRYWKSSKYIFGSFRKGWHPPHPTFFVKKIVYKQYGDFDLSMKVSADFELMLRLLEKFKIPVSYLPEVLVKMRVGGESNQNIKNIFVGNKNILKAFAKNDIEVSNFMYPLFRLLPKLKQFVFKT